MKTKATHIVSIRRLRRTNARPTPRCVVLDGLRVPLLLLI